MTPVQIIKKLQDLFFCTELSRNFKAYLIHFLHYGDKKI